MNQHVRLIIILNKPIKPRKIITDKKTSTRELCSPMIRIDEKETDNIVSGKLNMADDFLKKTGFISFYP
ncbi:hypothetical protein ETA_16370 [Erwinia tasmaniensis Et1/99]|uniref:Uncharacterized protein n=1 Tax=Erwinia tasmaniensis (strain DSM 17950 / CFBP 7177 / CIP 109463 / NCPPB 4357 / Et1/99) TaxID=465817 RepID=B2VKQ3_ERWT9|nr:hypothetical protein ETA_16370 [Erwinia tasmaniensis Et1/99]